MAKEGFRIERGPVVTIRHTATGRALVGDLIRSKGAVGIALHAARNGQPVELCIRAPLVSRPSPHHDPNTPKAVQAGTSYVASGNTRDVSLKESSGMNPDRNVPGVVAVVYEDYDQGAEREKLVWGPA